MLVLSLLHYFTSLIHDTVYVYAFMDYYKVIIIFVGPQRNECRYRNLCFC